MPKSIAAQIDYTSSQTEHFHCLRQTLLLRGELFHPAAEKEIVRDHRETFATSCFHRDTDLHCCHSDSVIDSVVDIPVWRQRQVAWVLLLTRVRFKCGDDGFYQDSLDVPHHSSKGDLQ